MVDFSYDEYLDVGGRYQIIQVDLRGCSLRACAGLPLNELLEVWVLLVRVLERSRPASFVSVLPLPASLSFFSPATAPKSSAFPGAFEALGVLEPKEAKAPLPRPNAEEALVVGEGTWVVGELRLLKGLDLPGACEESSVRRGVKVRGDSTLVAAEEGELEVARESLLDLRGEGLEGEYL